METRLVPIGLICVLTTASCSAQGTLVFNNDANSLVRFWDRDGVPVASGQAQFAWAPLGTPFVPWDYSGSAEAWQANNPGWTAIGPPAFVGIPAAGHFRGGILTVNVTSPGAVIQGVVIAWSSRYNNNAANFLEGAHSAFLFNISMPFTVDTGDPTTIPPGFPGSISHSTPTPFTGLDVPWIPEPSSFALAAVGAAVLFESRHRKKSGLRFRSQRTL